MGSETPIVLPSILKKTSALIPDDRNFPALHEPCQGEAWTSFELLGLLTRSLSLIQKENNQPLLVAIGGPGGTGKSTFSQSLHLELGTASSLLTLDDYKTPRAERAEQGIFGAHPEANKMDLIAEHMEALAKGETIQRPIYDAVSGSIVGSEPVPSRPIIIIDGEISTYESFRELLHVSIFIDAHWRTQLQTRLNRDIDVRQYSPEKAIETFLQSNLREFKTYGAHSIDWSDVLLWCDSEYQLSLKSIHPKWTPFFERVLYEDD